MKYLQSFSDKIYPLKSHSVKQYDGIKMSGEASESDHWKKTKWMYDLGITDDDTFITNYVKDMFNNRVYYGRGMDNYDERFWRVKDESLDYIYEYYRNIIRELKDHPLKHTTFWIPSYMDITIVSRIWDPRNEWFTPFADRKIQTMNVFKKKPRVINSTNDNSMKKKRKCIKWVKNILVKSGLVFHGITILLEWVSLMIKCKKKKEKYTQ